MTANNKKLKQQIKAFDEIFYSSMHDMLLKQKRTIILYNSFLNKLDKLLEGKIKTNKRGKQNGSKNGSKRKNKKS